MRARNASIPSANARTKSPAQQRASPDAVNAYGRHLRAASPGPTGSRADAILHAAADEAMPIRACVACNEEANVAAPGESARANGPTPPVPARECHYTGAIPTRASLPQVGR